MQFRMNPVLKDENVAPQYKSLHLTTFASNNKTLIQRPLNAFEMWRQVEIKKNNVQSDIIYNAEIMRTLKARLRQLTAEEKKPFMVEARILRKQHKNSMSVPNKKSRMKQPLNPFIIWSLPERKKISLKHPEMKTSEISKVLGTLWNRLSAEEKKPFIDEAKRLREKQVKYYPDCQYKSLHITQPPVQWNSSCALSNHLDGRTFMHNYESLAYEARTNSIETSKFSYGIPSIPHPPTTFNLGPYYPENQHLKSISAHNAQFPISPAYRYDDHLMYSNVCNQAVNRNEPVYCSLNNSSVTHRSILGLS